MIFLLTISREVNKERCNQIHQSWYSRLINYKFYTN